MLNSSLYVIEIIQVYKEMTDNQTNKYLYKVQADKYATEEELLALSKNIDNLIDGKWNDALNTSGYIADCILKAKKFFTIKVETVVIDGGVDSEDTSYTTLVVGEEGVKSKFFIPNGKKNSLPNYTVKEITGRFTYDSENADESISSSKVVNGNFVAVMDFTEAQPKIRLIPVRISDSNNNYWQYFFARPTTPSPVESLPVWWDTEKNVIKQYDAIHEWDDSTIKQFSIPLAIVHVENGIVKNIVQDFNVSGYNDQVIWVNPDILFGIADGRNDESAIDIVTATSGSGEFPEYAVVDITEKIIKQENEFSTSDTITTVVLNSICRDARTLTISVNNPDDEDAVLPDDTYSLGGDMLTITFTPELTKVNKLYIKYYDQPYSIPVFISRTGELIPPSKTANFTYNSNLGHYVNGENVKQTCARVGAYSLGYIAKKSLWTDEKLSIISYYSKQRSLLTDTEDVRYLIEQYSSELVESISIALNKAGVAVEDVQSIRAELISAIERVKNEIDELSGGSTGGVTPAQGGTTSASLEKVYDETEIIPVGVKDISKVPTTGLKASLDLDDIQLGKTIIDGKYVLKAIAYDGTLTTTRRDYASYGLGVKMNIDGYDKFSFQIVSSRELYIDDTDSMGCAMEAAEGINTSGVTSSTNVRIGKNYIKAGEAKIDTLFLGGNRVAAFAGAGASKAYTLIAPLSYNVDMFKTNNLAKNSVGFLVEFQASGSVEEVTKADNSCSGVVSSSTLMYNNTSLQTVTIPEGNALIAFSGKNPVRVLGPAKAGDKLYFWNKKLRDNLSNNIKTIFMQALGISDAAVDSMKRITGCAISSSLIDTLVEVGSSTITDWTDENLYKCVGVATSTIPSVSYTGAVTVDAVVNLNFENNKSVNDIKRELGIQ